MVVHFDRKTEPLDAPLPGIVGDSPAMREVYLLTRLVAPTPGQRAAGWRNRHGQGNDRAGLPPAQSAADGPYVRVNCGA